MAVLVKNLQEPIHLISLGAGVQSSTMALMAAKGEITPMPRAAIFADTQDEPESVYKWLGWLEKQLPFPVIQCGRKEALSERCLSPYVNKSNDRTFMSIPAYVLNDDGTTSMIPRQCTRDFKIDPVTKAVNALRRQHAATAELWIGISTNEVYRAKVHRNHPRIVNRFPLFEKKMNRHDCLLWMDKNGFPTPPRSACYYCPYHNDDEWRRLKTEEPNEFAKAVAFEEAFQFAVLGTKLKGTPFLHRSCHPLDKVDLSTDEENGQLNMFNNECEGMCGV